MKLLALAEVVFRFYSDGNPRSGRLNLRQQDIKQMCRASVNNNIRQQYVFGQKPIAGRKMMPPPPEHDYYFWSPLLQVKRFALTDANEIGMRRADMKDFDLYRLPHNTHFSNIYMVNCACAGLKINTLTLVENGEEKFYAGKSKFKSFIFGSVVGRAINTFNVPPCIKSLDIETTYDNDEVDVSLDIAFDVAMEVLRQSLEVEQVSGDDKVRLQEELKKREDIK